VTFHGSSVAEAASDSTSVNATGPASAYPPESSSVDALLLPGLLCVAMIVVSAVLARAAAIDVRELFFPYFSGAAAITIMAVLLFVFAEVLRLAKAGANDPISSIKTRLRDRAALLLLPAIVLPAFLVGYTASKTAIQFLVGYSWDGFWANADRLLFGDDVWHLVRRFVGSSYSPLWEWFYTVGWGSLFFITANAVALYGRKRFVGAYFTAMLATWLVGGCFMAYAFSAAGPAFAHLFDPSLEPRFRPLRQVLAGSLGHGPIGFTQDYLASVVKVHVAVKGGGISAMPSMHLGAASIYALAARRTRWLVPALLFWVVIFVGSGYFGYHYWVDGIVAALVAAGCWTAAERYYGRSCPEPLCPPAAAEVRTSMTPISSE
jgi:hypothetical protein